MALKFKVQDSDNQQVSVVATNKHQTDNTAITLNNLFTITNLEFDDTVTGTIAVTNGTLSSSSFTGTDVSGITLTPVGLTVAGATSTVTVTANDGVAGHSNVSATATVRNGTPAWATAAGSLGSVVETQSFSATVTVTDTNTNTITHTAGTLPTGITLTDNGDNTATLSGTAPIVTSDTTFNFTLTTNDGTISVGRAFSILVTNAVSNWTTPQGLLGTFAELNAVNLTVTASHPLQTPTITLQSGSLPGGLSLTDNGNGTASISGTLNTLRSFDTTTTFTLRASSTTDTVDRTFSIIETSIDPVIGTFPVTAIPVGYSESYLITATQSDGTIPSLTLRDQVPFNTVAGLYKISAGNWSGVSQPFAGGNFTPSANTEPTQIERNFTFTDNNDGTATLTIAPQGYITSALGQNLIGANNNSQTVLFNNAQARVNELTDSDDTLSRAIRFVIRASTPQGVADQIFEVPLHKAPFINSGAVKVTNNVPHFNMYDVGNATTTFSKGVTHTVNLGFAVFAYNQTFGSPNTNPSVTIVGIEDNQVAVHGSTSHFDSFSLNSSGVLTFRIKQSAPSTGAVYLNVLLRDSNTNAQRQYQLRINL